MAEIYVAIRNQQGGSMSSIDGAFIIVLLTRSGQTISQKPATLRAAMARFSHLPGGDYTILARHRSLQPTEARYDHVLTDKTVLGVRFVYNEPQRLLVDIQVEVNELP